jgi:hypothetical protein
MISDTICNAINDRLVISFQYKGVVRFVEPHAVGSDRNGKLMLSAWQLSGGSGAGWRDYDLLLITGITVTEDKFPSVRPGYNPNDSTLSRIVCRL